MSVRKHVRWNEHGDPVLTIRAAGHSDVYRLACHLELGQSEFSDLGRRIIRSLRDRWGAAQLAALERFYWGPEGRHGRQARRRATLADRTPVTDDGVLSRVDTEWLLETLIEVRTMRPYDPSSGPGRAWDDAITVLARRIHAHIERDAPAPAQVAS